MVRAFAHGAMGHWIDPSWGGPAELFLIPASAPQPVRESYRYMEIGFSQNMVILLMSFFNSIQILNSSLLPMSVFLNTIKGNNNSTCTLHL